jgi:hypothetical protein
MPEPSGNADSGSLRVTAEASGKDLGSGSPRVTPHEDTKRSKKRKVGQEESGSSRERQNKSKKSRRDKSPPLILDKNFHPALAFGRFVVPAYVMYEEFIEVSCPG